jgi:enoyl-CoA hydratase/carnithine racemase
MAIIRCTKCHIVVLDSMGSIQKDVTCNECGSRYRIKVDGDKIVYFGKINLDGSIEALELEADTKQLNSVIYQKTGKIARIILNQPEQQNRINANMRIDILECIRMLETDDNVVVGIIKGNGEVFSAGNEPDAGDLRYGLSTRSDGRIRRPSQRARLWVGRDERKFISQISNCSKPLICQVHGCCFDDALEISIACDITVATKDCLFGHTNLEQRRHFGGMVGLYGMREVSLIGAKKTRELLLFGNTINGKEAERIGLVNCAVSKEQLESKVEKMAKEITSLPRDAIFLGKEGTKIALNSLEPSLLQGVVMKALSSQVRIETDEQEGAK